MARSVFTVVAEIESTEAIADLKKELAQIDDDLAGNPILPLSPDAFPELHFASFVIFDGDTKRPRLVFESSVDGPRDVYLRRVAEHSGIDKIYRYCNGYPDSPTPKARFDFLKGNAKSPNLYHVSTPYRTARSIRADRDIRQWMDRLLSGDTDLLARQLVRPAAGIKQYWRWELAMPWVAALVAVATITLETLLYLSVIWSSGIARSLLTIAGLALVLTAGAMLAAKLRKKPWVALPIAVVTIVLAAWLSRWNDWRGVTVWSVLAAIDMAIVGVLGSLLAGSLWRGSLPQIRARARHWVVAALLITCAAAASLINPDLPVSLWNNHRLSVTVAIIALVVLLVAGFGAALKRRRSERIAAMRSAGGDASVVPLWKTLKDISGSYTPEKPSWVSRLSNWRWWLLLPSVVLAAVLLLKSASAIALTVLVAMFCAKAAWLAALTGWPSADKARGQRTKGVAFVIAAMVAGILLVQSLFGLQRPVTPILQFFHLESLFGLETYTVLLAIAVALGLLGLWVLRVPTSEPAAPRLPEPMSPEAEETLRRVIDQEDHDVQNHMSLVAEVGPLWRRAVLMTFLFLLNNIFYRAVLPDAWRGKLFGLSTVHCAQWVLLDGGRFVFLSNYDHSWTSYLDDFGAHLGPGIQKIWGQCTGNPGTGNLERFKRYVRLAMVPYSVWYRAYPGLSVRQIWNNEHLRSALAREIPEEEAVQAVRRLGAAPKVLPEILHASQ
ncbi:MAG TPA: hypothetical protein VFV95_13920 [Vicinamibacterales bacterium]|nr:hypothetical protein [Vicinamibacterales bacterium]